MVSVLIPVYNARPFLRESIDSVLNQSYKDIEILICDDASSDGSFDILKRIEDSRIRLFQNKPNLGYLKTINKLLQEARGEYLAFHDADDISDFQRIEFQIQFLQENPAVGLVGTSFEIIDSQGETIECFTDQLTNPVAIKERLIVENVFQKPSVLFRRDVYNKIGGYREGFLRLGNISEDYDWLLRISDHFDMSNVNGSRPLYKYRSVSTAMSKNYKNPAQHVGHLLAQFLAYERKNGASHDSMDREDWEGLENQKRKMLLPYTKDPSFLYYEKAESLLYHRIYPEARKMALKAFLTAPWKFRNLYCLMSSIKRSIRRG